MTTTNSFTITCPGHDPERCSRGHRWVDHLGDDALSSAARRRPAYGGATRSHHPAPRGPFCGKHSGRETMAEEHNGQQTPWPASTVADELHGRQPIAAAEEPLPTTQHIHRLREAMRPSSPVASTARNTRVCRRQAPKALSIGGFWSRVGDVQSISSTHTVAGSNGLPRASDGSRTHVHSLRSPGSRRQLYTGMGYGHPT
jgi:hypothetical protein